MKPYFYAETAFHHEGSLEYLMELIDAAAGTGVDGIKFQVLTDASTFFQSGHPSLETIGAFLFSADQWKQAFRRAQENDLDLILMPLDPGALVHVEEFGIKYLELHSVSWFDLSLLEAIRQTRLPLILGAGGRTPEEIQTKISEFPGQAAMVMTGFQAFPSRLADVKLPRIKHYLELFPDQIIGYADHSAFDSPEAVYSNELAYLLGARCFEKHLTLHPGRKRTDYESAVSPEVLGRVVDQVLALHAMVEDGDVFDMNAPEITYRRRQKVAVCSQNFEKGHRFTEDDLVFQMSKEEDVLPDPSMIVGRVLNRDLPAHSVIRSQDLI